MVDINMVEIDGKKYIVIDAFDLNGKNYLALSNEENPFEYVIRKVIKENGEDYFVKLDSTEELDEVLKEYKKRHDRKGDENE